MIAVALLLALTTPPIRMGRDVKPPVVVSHVAPHFAACKGATVRGAPIAEIVVERDGKVGTIRLVRRSTSACVDAAFVEAVQHWRFRPATLRGKPVRVYYHLTATVHYD